MMFPNKPVYLFSHSMGTLVARCFLKKHDKDIDKLVLCGPPTRNKVVGLGLFLANAAGFFGEEKERNKFLDNLCFKEFNADYIRPFSWLSVNTENVENYNSDPLCGYTFTTNGFINLFKLQRDAFIAKDWAPQKSGLPILMIAGSKDPCIGSEELFCDLESFLTNEVGYTNVETNLYSGRRHELLNEIGKEQIWADILQFFDLSRLFNRT